MPSIPWLAALGLVAAMIANETPESHPNAGVVQRCSGERLPPVTRPPGGEARLPARPMWLWDSPKVLLDADARRELFAFCVCHGIDGLWMQVALERERAPDGTPVLQHAGAWRTLLREAHAAGLTVEALEGAPIYALKPHHG